MNKSMGKKQEPLTEYKDEYKKLKET